MQVPAISCREVAKPALIACLLALAGCTTPSTYSVPPVGTGWSRAPDLSVYGAMGLAGDIAREEAVLCAGRNPAEVNALWRTEFGAREDWIVAALADRYGAGAVANAERRPIGRVPCEALRDDRWRKSYARLLRMLELRLYPEDYWSTL